MKAECDQWLVSGYISEVSSLEFRFVEVNWERDWDWAECWALHISISPQYIVIPNLDDENLFRFENNK